MRAVRVLPLFAALALAAGCGDDDKSTETAAKPQPKPKSVTATRSQLAALSRRVGHDIFWIGPRRGYTYELTHTRDGNIFIRYLPPGVPVGAGSADFLSVGTYPRKDAFATVQEASKRPGETVRKLPDRGLAVAARERPQSVYFAYPKSTLLVEVYDPSPARAMRLVRGARVRPIS